MEIFDCAVLGAGPAGISASLTLGRARRKIAIFDNGTNRNRVTQESHGFITRDGIKPAEFRRIAVNELKKYPSVHFFEKTVIQVIKQANSELFQIMTFDKKKYLAEKVLLATGIQEVFPDVPDIRSYYGKSIFSCPYCDGWELRDQPLIIMIEDDAAAHHMAKLVFNWSTDLVVATNGHKMSSINKSELEKRDIVVIDEPIKKLYGNEGYLEKVEFISGFMMERTGGFIKPSYYRANHFAEQLGCELEANGKIKTDEGGRTSQKNIYSAGESAKVSSSTMIIVARDGYTTAFSINLDLTEERF